MTYAELNASKKLSDSEHKRSECGQVAQTILNMISHRTLRTMIRHVVALAKVLERLSPPLLSKIVSLTLPQQAIYRLYRDWSFNQLSPALRQTSHKKASSYYLCLRLSIPGVYPTNWMKSAQLAELKFHYRIS